ncbi:hypothetical protein CBL_10363 [Carabus blaptoides fortunei]
MINYYPDKSRSSVILQKKKKIRVPRQVITSSSNRSHSLKQSGRQCRGRKQERITVQFPVEEAKSQSVSTSGARGILREYEKVVCSEVMLHINSLSMQYGAGSAEAREQIKVFNCQEASIKGISQCHGARVLEQQYCIHEVKNFSACVVLVGLANSSAQSDSSRFQWCSTGSTDKCGVATSKFHDHLQFPVADRVEVESMNGTLLMSRILLTPRYKLLC